MMSFGHIMEHQLSKAGLSIEISTLEVTAALDSWMP
jgi:hypothetical protein